MDYGPQYQATAKLFADWLRERESSIPADPDAVSRWLARADQSVSEDEMFSMFTGLIDRGGCS